MKYTLESNQPNRRFALRIEYDGTAFKGWQSQRHHDTVQDHLEKALLHIFQQPVVVSGTSRTDAGVHAKCQVATVQLPHAYDGYRLFSALNALTPRSIRVREVVAVSNDFFSRKLNIGKLYSYLVCVAASPPALWQNYCWHLPLAVDLEKIAKLFPLLLGEHDFTAFSHAECDNQNPCKRIDSVDMTVQTEAEQMMIRFEIRGNSFLRHMVRIMVGTLVNAGQAKLTEHQILDALRTRDRRLLGVTAPACGLCLEKIFFPFALFQDHSADYHTKFSHQK